jgi:hypothetical protein
LNKTPLSLLKISFIGLLLLWLSVRIFFYYFPVHGVIFKNRIKAFFGLDELINISTLIEEKEKFDEVPGMGYLGHYQLHNFKLNGVQNQSIIYSLQGDKLTFQDKKIWLVRTPLIKLGIIENPVVSLQNQASGSVTCKAVIGEYYDREKRIILKKNAVCTTPKEQFYARSVNLNVAEGKLTAARYSGGNFEQDFHHENY